MAGSREGAMVEVEEEKPSLLLAVPFRTTEGAQLSLTIGDDGSAKLEAELSGEVVAGTVYGLRGRVESSPADAPYVLLVEHVWARGWLDYLVQATRLDQLQRAPVRREEFSEGHRIRARIAAYGKPGTVVRFELSAHIG
jgi:hypothetical protein